MLKAFCDRCGEEIPDFDEEKMRLNIVTGGMALDDFDLCPPCLKQVESQISDWIKGAGHGDRGI